MSRDIRVNDNHALIHAQKIAYDNKLPLVVSFNILSSSGNRSREHFSFMLDSIKEVDDELSKLNISFALTFGNPEKQIIELVDRYKPREIVFDFNPLRGRRRLQKKVAKSVECSVSVVDAHNVIPVWVTSDKEEYAAHTIRTKIHNNLTKWLVEPEKVNIHPYKMENKKDINLYNKAIESLENIEKSGIKIKIAPGEKAAKKLLNDFISNGLNDYAIKRNLPDNEGQSGLSPYLHFGNISSLRVALDVVKQINETPLLFKAPKLANFEGVPNKIDSVNALLEELIVRKELAENYCFYNRNYDNLLGAKDWAIKTLNDHISDDREFLYTNRQLEDALTHDDAWNAAQQQMRKTGKMHGYMRMYWAKKILEWTDNPETAIQTAIYLNDKYSLDGGDPNGYTGIMWSIAGVHDRPWFERSVFGKIRYMNYSGLQRKFNLSEYINKWT